MSFRSENGRAYRCRGCYLRRHAKPKQDPVVTPYGVPGLCSRWGSKPMPKPAYRCVMVIETRFGPMPIKRVELKTPKPRAQKWRMAELRT